MRKPDIIDQVVRARLLQPGLIDWSGIRSDLLKIGIELDRRVLISRVRNSLRNK